MIITYELLKTKLKDYSNLNNKISRDIKNGKLFKIVKGLYETNANVPGHLLAGSIYGPSYISFEYALSIYGLIPERVEVITNATLEKKKIKQYNTSFGTFTYRDIPTRAYPLEILLKKENEYTYQIASPEKAICDKLYTLKPLNNYSNLETMLFDDLRIDELELSKLDVEKINKLSNFYNSTNITLFAKYMRRYLNE